MEADVHKTMESQGAYSYYYNLGNRFLQDIPLLVADYRDYREVGSILSGLLYVHRLVATICTRIAHFMSPHAREWHIRV